MISTRFPKSRPLTEPHRPHDGLRKRASTRASVPPSSRRTHTSYRFGLINLFFTVSVIVVLVWLVVGLCECGGAEFTSIALPASDAGTGDAGTGDAGAAENVGAADVGEREEAGPDVDESFPQPDASVVAITEAAPCAALDASASVFPPECGSSTLLIEAPRQYLREQEILNYPPPCSVVATPDACLACGAYTCDCLLAHQSQGKSCSCAIVDSTLLVVTCQ